MALINAKNGMLVATAALAAGSAIAQGINALRAKAQSKGLADEITPELNRLQAQLDSSQSALQTLQSQLTAMHKSLAVANRTKVRWAMASFRLGLVPFTLKMLGYL